MDYPDQYVVIKITRKLRDELRIKKAQTGTSSYWKLIQNLMEGVAK